MELIECPRCGKIIKPKIEIPSMDERRALELYDTLTKRQKDVVSELLKGLKNRDIAQALGISEQVVKNYLRKVYDKFGMDDRLSLIVMIRNNEYLEKFFKGR